MLILLSEKAEKYMPLSVRWLLGLWIGVIVLFKVSIEDKWRKR